LLAPIAESVSRTGRLLASEEGTRGFSFGSEVVARIAETVGTKQRAKFRQVGAARVVIPSDKSLEREMLPSSHALVTAALEMIEL